MKVIFKIFLFKILNFFSKFIFVKKDILLDNINVIIILRKPLGLGDLVMLSPFVVLLEKKFKKNIYLLTEYDSFINLKNVIWIKPQSMDKNLFKNSIVISPTLAFSHLKYIFYAKYFIGYFISNKLISNIKEHYYAYNPKADHYLEKVFPILEILNIKYDENHFEYPIIKSKQFNMGCHNYIVISPYSNWNERQYPKENYINLIKKLILSTKLNIVLIGSNAEEEVLFNSKIESTINNSLIHNMTGQTSIEEMSYLIKSSYLFIGNDSGPSHIGYIMAKRSLIFFGSVFYENRLPLNKMLSKRIIALDSRDSCTRFPCYDGYNKPTCNNQYNCLTNTLICDEEINMIFKDFVDVI